MNDGLMVAFLIAIVLIGSGILFLLAQGRKSGKNLDVNKYRSQWLKIERQLLRDQESSYHLAILNADKLLDQALRQRGFKGQTMGERMKSAKDTWTNTNTIWTAHKIRNEIAHEADVTVRYEDARRALAAYKQGLKDVGAI
jgi:hypothetical protein